MHTKIKRTSVQSGAWWESSSWWRNPQWAWISEAANNSISREIRMRGSNNNYTFAERLDGTLCLAWVSWTLLVLMSYLVPKNSSLDGPYRSHCHIEVNVRCWCSLPLAALFPIISWHLFFPGHWFRPFSICEPIDSPWLRLCLWRGGDD